MKDFLSANERTQELLYRRVTPYEFVVFVKANGIIPIVEGKTAIVHRRHIAQRHIALGNKHVGSFCQIGIDVAHLLLLLSIKQKFYTRGRIREAHNHAMHMCLKSCFTIPAESAMGKVYLHTFSE